MKRSIIITILLAVVAYGCGGGSTDYNYWLENPDYLDKKAKLDENPGECQVIIIGDSRVEWGPFEDQDQGWCNYGISGDVTWGVENRLDAVIAKHPESVVIQLGRNDIAMAGRDVVSTFSHYKDVIDILLGRGIKVFVTSALPDIEPSFSVNSMVGELNLLLEEYCSANGVTYVDLYFLLAPDGYLIHTNDGVHPNQTGYLIFSDLVEIALI